MASEIRLDDLSKSTHRSSSPTRSGLYNPSYDGSKTSSRRPLYAPRQNKNTNGNGATGEHILQDNRSEETAFTETTQLPRRSLGFVQVTSLMLNACLGSGFFFTTPGYVLALVHSKRICLVLWAIGGIYSAFG